MLNAYFKEYRTFLNNECVGSDGSMVLCEESEIKEQVIPADWNTIDEIFSKYGLVIKCGLYYANKGKVITYNDGEHFADRKIKQWKMPQLDLQLAIRYKKITISLNELMRYHDGDKAIQYIKERGLDINKGK